MPPRHSLIRLNIMFHIHYVLTVTYFQVPYTANANFETEWGNLHYLSLYNFYQQFSSILRIFRMSNKKIGWPEAFYRYKSIYCIENYLIKILKCPVNVTSTLWTYFNVYRLTDLFLCQQRSGDRVISGKLLFWLINFLQFLKEFSQIADFQKAWTAGPKWLAVDTTDIRE